jgi:signal transduction histidine kinase
MAWRGRDGRLWFTTFEGVIGIDPTTSLSLPSPPRVYIDRVEVNQKRWPANAPIRLEPGDGPLRFRFVAINYSAPDQVRLRHRLAGYDFGWVETSRDRSATYGRLPPGKYTLQVTAANADAKWAPMATLPIEVLPSWWQTWWARAAFEAGFSLGVAGLARYWSVRRLHRRLERLEREHALEKERARIARDLHDDLGGSLTQIGLLADRVRRQAAEPAVKPALGQLVWRTRRLADELESIVWTVSPRNNTWDKLACFIDQYARSFCRDTPLACSVTGLDRVPALPLSPEAQHNILSVVKEALNNVLKHAHASTVTVDMHVTPDDMFELRITDDGTGFDPASPEHSEHNGLSNMNIRMTGLGGEIEIKSSIGRGTKVCLRQSMRHYHPATARSN